MSGTSEIYLCYVPCPDKAIAEQIATEAVRQKLAACGNILPQMQSIYEWKGKLENASETLLLLKTAQNKREGLSDLIKKMHPYETPCIAFYAAGSVNWEYMLWVQKQTT